MVSELLFEELKNSLKWKQDKLRMYGKEHFLPRLQAWYGDEGTDYRYSGIDLSPNPWTSELFTLKKKTEKYCERKFNSLLANYYRTGTDYVAWHADKEKELGPEPFIASLSFGAVRKFQLKHRYEKLPTITLDLEPGSLVIMSGSMQANWHHRIAPTKKECDPRINLTFRQIIF
jgi:alkylated DNA repair dioxygenase AlkB